MKVAVWDTYVKKKNGDVMHFDIIIPEKLTNKNIIYKYGEEYIASKNEVGSISTDQCQFCHIEDPSPEIIQDIQKQGYHILEMDDIAAQLPEKPTRRDLILYLRAHYVQYRFADLRTKSEAELRERIDQLTN